MSRPVVREAVFLWMIPFAAAWSKRRVSKGRSVRASS